MKKIILTAIGLAMLATPLAAENAQSGIAWHELNRYGLDPHTPSVQVPVRSPERFYFAPAGRQSFGLALGTDPAGFDLAGPYQAPRDRYGPIHR